jgi:urease accessory protein
MRWLVLQLADSAFPAGGFAHSAGLEAAVQLGEVAGPADLAGHLRAVIWQAALGGVPLVVAALEGDRLAELDTLAEAFLSSHVARAASRAQGRAFAAAAVRAFDEPGVLRVEAAVRGREVAGHLAPVWGTILGALSVEREEAARVYLHVALRGVLSAAVRLGRVGPLEAQKIQRGLAAVAEAALAAGLALPLEQIAQPAPIQEILGAHQDRLYSRLFQS